MLVKISKEKLLKALNKAVRLINNKSPLIASTYYQFSASNNQLVIKSTDIENLFTQYIDCEVISEGEVLVNSAILNIVKDIKSNFIEIKKNSNNISFRDINGSFDLLVLNYSFPFKEESNFSLITGIPIEDLRLSIASVNILSKDTEGDLNFNFYNNTLTIRASDRKRVSFSKLILATSIVACSFALTTNLLEEFNKLFETGKGEVLIYKSNSHVKFAYENNELVCKLRDEKNYDLDNLLKDEDPLVFNLETKDFHDSIKRVLVLSKTTKLVRLDIEGNEIKVSSNDPLLGTGELKISCNITSSWPIKDNIILNGEYLLQSLGCFKGEKIYTRVRQRNLLFIGEYGDNKYNSTHMISLLKRADGNTSDGK